MNRPGFSTTRLSLFLATTISMSLICIWPGSTISNADNSTPPRTMDLVSDVMPSQTYKPGDVIAFQVNFTTDSYGLKNLSTSVRSLNECVRANMILGPNPQYGYGFKGVKDDPKLNMSGYLTEGTFRFFGELTSDCFNGSNVFGLSVGIIDYSNLSSTISKDFQINVIGGLAKRPGESRGPDQQIANEDYSVLFLGKKLNGSTLEIPLPSFTREGVSLIWGTRGGSGPNATCEIKPKSSPENFSPILLVRNSNPGNPYCELWYLSDRSTLDIYSDLFGSLDFYLLNGETVSYSQYQQFLKSKSSKTTITCVKGKLTKKITGINPKCPMGYTKK